jgi:HK97 family phage major capsid protein/HK97 family phage prohead protease
MSKDFLSRFLSESQTRFAKVGEIDNEKRTIDLAFSSDAELERWPGVVEVLDHRAEAVELGRLNDGGAFLFNHDWDQVIGVVENARIDSDGRGRATVRFGSSTAAEEKWRDVQDGILRHISVGYRIKEVKLTEEREDLDVYTVQRWEPYEISLVTVPADHSVGIGRSQSTTTQQPENQMKSRKGLFMQAPNEGGGSAAPAAPAAPTIDVVAERNAARNDEQNRVRTILEAGKKYGMGDLAQEAIVAGKSVDEARQLFLEELNKRNTAIQDASRPVGLSDKEARNFSFLKLVRALSAEPSDKATREAARFELEACAAAADQITHRSPKGTMIPVDVLRTPLAERSTNTVSVKTGSGYISGGANVVDTTLLVSSFVDLLRNRTVIMQLGTPLAGLVGNVDIPTQTQGASGYWIGEDADANKDDIDFGIIQLRPKTVANYGEITRRMLMQSSMDVEALFRADLARGLALAMDSAGFYGDGTSNTPIGIKSTLGINSANFAAVQPTYADLVAMEAAIDQDNALAGALAYVGNTSLRSHAKTTLKFAGIDGTLWEPGNTLNGYRTEITNQVTSGDVFFGNFADLLIGMWGGLEITVDPYTHSTKGRLRIVAMQDVDFLVRRAASFCFGKKPATP